MTVMPYMELNQLRKRLCALVLAVLLLCICSAGSAQVTTATITGTVSDTSSAAIPGAKVTVTNRGNKFSRTAIANGSGVFSFPGLDSGDYQLTITYKGFETFVVSNIHLDPSDTRNITTIRMAAGSVNETITVNSSNENHVEDDGSRSALITAEDLQKLSLEGREVTELLKILPGSAINTGVGNNTGSSNSTFDPGIVGFGGAAGSYSVSGSPVNGVAIRSDGANLTDPGTGAGSLQTINAEATSEVKIQTSNFGADNANGPLVVSAVGKAGASEYHGSVYVYGRTSQLNSTDSIARVFNSVKPPDHYIYPGLSLGGPIKIPGTNLNRQKHLTFFVSGEDYVQREVYAYGNVANAVTHALVPTAAMRMGDFSIKQIQSYLPPGLSKYACDPSLLTGSALCTNLNLIPLSGNGTTDGYNGAASNWNNLYQVPVSTSDGLSIKGHCNGVAGDCLAGHLDPGASAFFRLIPLPNTPGGTTTPLGYNYSHTDLVNSDIYEVHGRLDFEKGRSKFYLTFTPENGQTNVPQNFGYFASGNSGGVDTPGGSKQINYTYSGSFNWNLAASSTLNNEAFVSGLYSNVIYSPQRANLLFDNSIGYPYTGAYDNGTQTFPNLGTYGNEGIPLGFFPDFSYGSLYNRTYAPGGGDNLSKQLAKHSVKVGVNVERPRINSTTYNNGTYTTNGTTQIYYVGPQFQLPDPSKVDGEPYIKYNSTCFDGANGDANCAKENGNSNNLANYLVGDLGNNGWDQSNIIPKLRLHAWTTSMYVTDDWKVAKRLSLTVGLRVEHIGRWVDDHGFGAATFSPTLYAGESNSLNNPALPLPGFRWHSIDSSVPISGFQTREFFYEPRAGFSWDVYGTAKTTLSGGYGLYRFRDGQQDAINSILAPNGYRQLAITPPSQDPATIGVTGAVPNQGGLRASYIQSLHISPKPGIATSTFAQSSGNGYLTAGSTSYAVDPTDSQVPQTQNYNLTVTQQFPRAITFSLGYVGNYSSYLLDDNSGGGQQSIANINAIPVGSFFHPDPNPGSAYYGVTYTPSNIGGNGFAVNDYRPYPRYAQIQIEKHILTAHYDALQLTVERSKGALYLKANYTWSKNYGQRGGYSNGVAGDSFNLANDYGPLAYDRTHILNLSYNYNFGTDHGGFRFVRPMLNGWQLSGITNLQSGPDLLATNYTSNFGLSGQNSFSSVPLGSSQYLGTTDVNLQPLLTCNPTSQLARRQYINANCFTLPQPGGYNGPFRYPYIHGPAFFQSDLTVIKGFKLKEKQQLEFRLAAFNFLNYKLKTFTNLHPNALNLIFNNAIPQNGTFGFSEDNAGRRIMEANIRYSF
jgi:hypothetical protein